MSYTFKPEQKIAHLIAKKYSLYPPVDVLSVLKKYADYEEDVIPYNVDGVCVNDSEKPLVILNLNQSDNRKRFTLAHELGHLVIPWHVGMISCHTESKVGYDEKLISNYSMELEANNFAAEILMPTTWIVDIIEKYEIRGLSYVIKTISKEAEVSLYAATFTVFNLLPYGYIAFIKDKEKDYGKHLESPGTEILIPFKGGLIDKDWLNKCAIDFDEIYMDSYTISWWKIENLISTTWLSEVIKNNEKDGLTNILSIISNKASSALPIALLYIHNLLPLGYVTVFAGGDYQRVFMSPGTTIKIPRKDNIIDVIKMNENAADLGKYNFNGYTIYWWKFVIHLPKNTNSSDSRLSKEIISGIIREIYYADADRKLFLQKVNGVIGALNSQFAPKCFEDFYLLLKQRFMGREEFDNIISHPDFENFMIKRIKEILQKRME